MVFAYNFFFFSTGKILYEWNRENQTDYVQARDCKTSATKDILTS